MAILRENRRKVIHLGMLFIPAIHYFASPKVSRFILVSLATLFLLADIIRLHHPRIKAAFLKTVETLLRPHEFTSLTGATYLFLSAACCVFLYDRMVAVYAVSLHIVGDSVAALVGNRYGRHRLFTKTVEGTLACFTSCLAVGLVLPRIPWMGALIGAVAATLLEVFLHPIDDNLTIPVISGATVQYIPPMLARIAVQ